MTINDFFSGLWKYKKILVFLTALAILLCSVSISIMERSTAEVIIKYLSEDAKWGWTDTGEPLNPYEIASATVVQNAMDEIGIGGVNAEDICRNIEITPIVPTAEEEKYASWIDNFANYEDTEEDKEEPVYYSVKFTTSAGRDFAKAMLSAVVNQYRLYYMENYIYSSDIMNLEGEVVLQHDYYETVDMLMKKISSNIEYLENIASSDLDYRSPHTGYSINDLISKYKALNNRQLAVANRIVLDGGISKDYNYFKSALETIIIDSENESKLNADNAATSKTLMELYAAKNKEYLWDMNDRDNEHDASGQDSQVREDVERDYTYTQEMTTYDQLVLDYVDYRSVESNALFDKEMYENVKSSFSHSSASEDTIKNLEQLLSDTCNDFNELYNETKLTLDDYNDLKSGRSIERVSDIVVRTDINTVLYYAVSVCAALIIGVGLSVLFVISEKRKNSHAGRR